MNNRSYNELAEEMDCSERSIEVHMEASCAKQNDFSLTKATLELLTNTFPTFICYLSIVLINELNLYYAGTDPNPNLMPGIGLGNTWFNSCFGYIIIGLDIGMTAICAQALGAKHYEMAGLAFHKALISRFAIAVLFYPGLYFSAEIFKMVGVEPEIAKIAGTYCQYQTLNMIFVILFDTLKGFLMAHNVYLPFVAIQAIGTPLHLLWLHLFITKLELGIVGYGLAMACTNAIFFLLTLTYMLVWKPSKEAFFFFRKESFVGLAAHVIEEFPIGAILYLDFAAFEIAVLFTGAYPAEEMAAQIVMYNVFCAVNMPILGLCSTLTTFVGNSIGEGNAHKTKQYIKAGMMITFGFIAIEGPCLFLYGEHFSRLFTQNEDIVEISRVIQKMYAVAIVADFTQLAVNAVLRGIGKEHVACVIFITGYYAIGLPLGFLLGSVFDWYSQGVWTGIIAALVFICSVASFVLSRVDMRFQISEITSKLESKIETQLSIKELKDLKDIRQSTSSCHSAPFYEK